MTSGPTNHLSSESSESSPARDGSDKAGLKAGIRFWDRCGNRFAAMVVLGLFMEYTLGWFSKEARYFLSGWITHWPYLHLMQIAHGFVVIGVAGELLAHRKQSVAFDGLSLLQERESEETKLKVAEANRTTEELRLENLKLKERLAPRGLTESQLAALHDQAIVLGERDLDIVIIGGLSETKEFAKLISWPFRVAKWNVRFFPALPEVSDGGISLFRSVHAKPSIAQVASGLLAAFSFAKIPCRDGGTFSANDLLGAPMGEKTQKPSAAEIRIFIGEKLAPDPTPDLPTFPQ
jgi:hypothetical protein